MKSWSKDWLLLKSMDNEKQYLRKTDQPVELDSLCFYVVHSLNQSYSSGEFSNNGFFIGNLHDDFEAMRRINNIENKVIESKLFESSLTRKVFNENRNLENSFGRHMVKFDSLTCSKDHCTLYSVISSDIKQLSKDIIIRCNAKLAYSINLEKALPTILQTADEDTKPQILHIDVDPSKHYEEQLLALVALQDYTMIRVVIGSHISKEFDWAPCIITLMRGEYIIMNPKLIHSGWTAISQNIRVHFYLGLSKTDFNADDKTYHLDDSLHMQKLSKYSNKFSSLGKRKLEF